MLNWILRASKLYGRHLSLEPDLKPESSFSAGNFLATFKLELARDEFFLNGMLNRILRASKLYGRHLSLEPDLKPESSFSAKKSGDL